MLPLSAARTASLLNSVRPALAKGKLGEARAALEQVLAMEPRRGDLAFQLAQICYQQGDRDACLTHLDRAVELAPDQPQVTALAVARYRALGRPEQALAAYDRQIAADPKAIKPRADKAHYLQLLGRFDEAETIFRALIKRHPNAAELYRIFLASKKLKPGDPLLRAMERLWARSDLPDAQRMHLGFALAKAMEETGQTAKVFGYLRRANALQAKAAPFDSAAQAREFAAVRAAQAGLAPGAPAEPDLRPVFVTGMPRSGTTLVERILGAHPEVTAGGELGHALKLAYGHFGAGEQMRRLADEPPARVAAFAEQYLRLAARDSGRRSGVITDKSILCHLIFGLLDHALPGARIVVVQRDPRDIALSIYKNHFATGSHRYANDLPLIATAIKRFRANVAHWKDALPGRIHEIRYEDLVADPEPHTRALVTAAGLPWDEACLSSHEAAGQVKTLSVSQARQPIYRGSALAWKKYETELAPFIEAWGEEPWD
ncbi:tetratricopeptide repeat-containing sulfotransferase family protein [Alloyangia pacifica]|uniref:tetratricopeptide repeat-containing sulfotransferase family protein n=1 Tax=Alloyangia pacifica TaxID=311180 RepID=UPI001CD693AF|nr:sulfotransferase [Alloyangia pacifica]MCA0995180.1 sulfotransferase [Alloyangia pacifica]